MQVFIKGIVRELNQPGFHSVQPKLHLMTWVGRDIAVSPRTEKAISMPSAKGLSPVLPHLTTFTHHSGVSLLYGGSGIPAMLPCISSIPSADGELLPWFPSAFHSGCANTALATATKPEGIIKGQGQ